MKRVHIVLGILVSLALVSAAFGFGGPPPEKEQPKAVSGGGDIYLIDDFESGSLRTPREWWTFDIQNAEIASNAALTAGDSDVAGSIGSYSLLLKGPATNWYAGGCGTYIAKENTDLSKYNSFVIDIYGNGEGSGTIKIELFDDDNNNWQVEQDSAKSYAPIYDDKLVYSVAVDWSGWQRVSIPLDDFVDDNPGVGDDVWNPVQSDGSGGFLQIQFVCIASTDKGMININADSISLSVSEE
jgi:hypothetical protein